MIEHGYDPPTHSFWAQCQTCGFIKTHIATIAGAYDWGRQHKCQEEP